MWSAGPISPTTVTQQRSWRIRGRLIGCWVIILIASLVAIAALDGWSQRTLHRRMQEVIEFASTKTVHDARILRYQWEATLTRTRALHRLARELELTSAMFGAEVPVPMVGAYYAMRKAEIVNALEFGNFGELAQVALIDERAIVTWSTTPLPAEPIDLSAREHVRAILVEGRDWFLGTPVIGRVSNTFTIQVAAAVRDHQGQRRGVSVVSLSVKALANYLREISLGPSDLILIAREDGVVLASNDEGLIARPLPAELAATLRQAAEASTPAETQAFGRTVVLGSLFVKDEGTLVAVIRDFHEVTAPVRQIGGDLQPKVFILQVALVLLGLLLGLLAAMRNHANWLQQDRRLRELAARSTEAFARIAEAGPGVLYRLRPLQKNGWRIDIMGSAISGVTGHTAAEGCTPNWLPDTTHHDDWPELEGAVSAAFEGSGSTIEYRMRSRAGGWLWVQNTLHLSWDPEIGHIVIGYLLDITQHKETSLILAQTSKLTTLGEMAAGMAHELNQPLATIAMAAENAKDTLQEVQPRGAMIDDVLLRLDRILGQADRAARLIQHLRAFARRDADYDRPVTVRDAVAGTILLLESRLRTSCVRVEQDLPEPLPAVIGNQILLEQVLVNLFLNSLDAYEHQAGEAALADMIIRIVARVENGEMILTVTDRAGGIDPSVLGRVFEPFFTTKPEGKGTGLGLSFCYGIVRGMNGYIAVANCDGGAAFTIRLPVVSSR